MFTAVGILDCSTPLIGVRMALISEVGKKWGEFSGIRRRASGLRN